MASLAASRPISARRELSWDFRKLADWASTSPASRTRSARSLACRSMRALVSVAICTYSAWRSCAFAMPSRSLTSLGYLSPSSLASARAFSTWASSARASAWYSGLAEYEYPRMAESVCWTWRSSRAARATSGRYSSFMRVEFSWALSMRDVASRPRMPRINRTSPKPRPIFHASRRLFIAPPRYVLRHIATSRPRVFRGCPRLRRTFAGRPSPPRQNHLRSRSKRSRGQAPPTRKSLTNT
ncbi:hypothetical protein NNJEOMEG_04015 [Fundidesulfovibrio magnetotacticus]|uniref:Uncharacterized protein n=1 Tax=Fundidesulfovibrio magnetotacticus TaxID=2730080 RepID=A0A6V8M687_9BACT|nr:hypothetical protein NNJEOMEG_04015 [Fundidesulfovibrio magnetotacticus]